MAAGSSNCLRTVPRDVAAQKVLAAFHRCGLLIISAGTFGNVIGMLVPLIAADAQIEEGLLVLEQASTEAGG